MKLMSNLSEETNASGVGVAIGSEMHTPGLLHASVVSSGYGRSGAAGEPAGNDPVGEPETESETESQTNDTEPIAFVGSIGRPTWTTRPLCRRQGRSQIFDRLPLRADSRLTPSVAQ